MADGKAKDLREGANALAAKLFDELLNSGSTYIYRQYMNNRDHLYVSLWAVDLCRKDSGYRIATRSGQEAMAQVNGAKSYVFRIGEKAANAGTEQIFLKFKPVSQQDSYISSQNGKESTYRYAYISVEDAKELLNNSCVYVPGTEWAVLVSPKVNSKVKAFLDALEAAGDDFIFGE